ncbi:hypothetical protein Tco_0702199 [Tanacetum coccineum]|uniref:Transposase (Putative), gypsy type n=1 Tax=Tanacetum coccineum TaxID=301880 RepID=A0ABQ4XV87_9ASTR
MIAFLEKTERNVEFHEVIDFLRRSYIYHALTVSPVVSTTFVEQFWTSAKSKTINNARHITAKVAGKIVSISRGNNPNLILDEGASSERLSDEQPSPSPAPTSEVPYEPHTDSSSAQPKPTGENLGDHSSNDTSLSGNEDQCQRNKTLEGLNHQASKKQAKPVIKHFKAYLKTVSLQQRLPRKSSSKKQRMHKESVSKQGRKIAKGESSVQRDPLEDKRKGDEGQEIDEVRLSTEDAVSTDKEGVSTDFEKVSTDFEKVSTDKPKVSTDGSKVSTDEQVEGIDRPSKTVYNITSHLKASSKIDPQDKGKKKFKEDDESESEDVILPQAVKKFTQLEREKSWQETKLRCDRILLRKLSKSKKESISTIDENAKFPSLYNLLLREKFLAPTKNRGTQNRPTPDEDKEVDYEILDKKYPIIDWKTENLGTKPQIDESKRSEEINMNVVTRSNGQKRSFSTLMRVLSVFDREDLDANKELSIPEQMATGIGTSNPLMAGKMDLNAFIRTADPRKVRIVERPRTENERPIVTVAKHRTVTLLPTSVSRPSGELSESIEREFVEDGSSGRGQEDASVAGHEQGVHNLFLPYLPSKKLKEDYGTSGGHASSGKSSSIIREHLASSILNSEVGVAAIPTLPFVTSSVFATPERDGDDFTDDVTGPNLRTIGPPVRSVDPPIMTEAVVTTEAAGVSSHLFPKTVVDTSSRFGPDLFLDSDSSYIERPVTASTTQGPDKELSMGSREVDSKALHEIFVPQWNVLNDTLLDEHDISCEFIDHLAPPVLFSQIRNMDYHHLFTEFNVGTARQACLNGKVRMRAEFCLSERTRLEVECGRQASLLKSKDKEIEVLKAQLTVKEAEAAEAIHLRAQIVAMERAHTDEVNVLQHNNAVLEGEKNTFNDKVMELQSSLFAKDLEAKELAATAAIAKSQNDSLVNVLKGACSELREQVSAYESLKEQIEEFQDEQMRVMFDKLAKLEVDLIEIALHLEEKFYPHLLTIIAGRRCLLTHGLKLFITKCLNSSEYLVALGAAISRATEKGMQVGLTAGIEHGKQGRGLEELVAYNPSAEEDYNTALRRVVMNLLRLSDPLANLPGMSDLQPDVEQLMVPIHRPEDQVVLGASSLTFSLSVSRDRVERIRQNIAEHSLTGDANTSDVAPSAATTTTALSTTFASASTIPPVSVDDYVVADVVNEENVQPNVEYKGEGSAAADINFEKEELDTTP